jgi:hypothetical protein
MANLDTQTPHNYHIVGLAINGIFQKYVQLAPSEVASFTCDDFVACGTAGWLTVRADTPVFGATLFVINTLFGGGSFTAQPPVCTLLPP